MNVKNVRISTAWNRNCNVRFDFVSNCHVCVQALHKISQVRKSSVEEPPSLKMAAQPEQVLDLLFDQDGVLTTEVTTTETRSTVLQDASMPTLSFVSPSSE